MYVRRMLMLLHDVMRQLIYRRKDVIYRPLRQNFYPAIPLPTIMRNFCSRTRANPCNIPLRMNYCSDFKQRFSSASVPHYHDTPLLTSKFKAQCYPPIFWWERSPSLIFCNWIWSATDVQGRRNRIHFFCQQSRNFSNNNDGNRSKSKRQHNYELSGKRIATDPFATLGIVRSPTMKYTNVKSKFLKIAMKYHPDMTSQCTDAEREANKDLFVSARKAFESIVANPDGMAILKTEADNYIEEEDDFEVWFKNEAGYDIPFMDAATMKEVAEMTDTVGGGLDRDGGMWTLARMVANTVREGGDSKSILQLDAGIIRDRAIDGILRRRRKR